MVIEELPLVVLDALDALFVLAVLSEPPCEIREPAIDHVIRLARTQPAAGHSNRPEEAARWRAELAALESPSP
jgi:hypothetical protein